MDKAKAVISGKFRFEPGTTIDQILSITGGSLIYLASPYSDGNPEIQEHRFLRACATAAELMRSGLWIFSPIAHTHPIAQFGLPKGWDFWEPYDRRFLNACGGMIVLNLPGWVDSKGIAGEVQIMRATGKPIWHITPEE